MRSWCTHELDATDHGWVSLNIQKIPQIDEDSNANSNNREYAIYLGAPGTCHEDARSNQPAPPLGCERSTWR